MTIYGKLKWILGILLVFGLVLATNLIDRNNFSSVRDAIVTIYEDRLIANDLLFDLSAAIHQKELAWAQGDTAFLMQGNTAASAEISALLLAYEQTELTEDEHEVFKRLKRDVAALEAHEKAPKTAPSEVRNTLDLIKNDLRQLSKIQLTEGRRQMLKSNEALGLVDLYTRIEIIFLVVLAVLLQVIVLYKPKREDC